MPTIKHQLSHQMTLTYASLVMMFLAGAIGGGSAMALLAVTRYPAVGGQVAMARAEPAPKSTLSASRPSPYAPMPVDDYTLPSVEDGLAPVLINIPTTQRVVFLGIDDGANKDASELKLLLDNDIKATLFLADMFIADDPTFFKQFAKHGYPIEDHTVSHRLLSQLSYEEQKKEICDEADVQFQQFGRRPVLLRPPGGDYNLNTRRAAAACGMKAVVNWVAKANGGAMQYQTGDSLQPGDIVLMHFRPEFATDLTAFIDAKNKAGLHVALLEDWLAD